MTHDPIFRVLISDTRSPKRAPDFGPFATELTKTLTFIPAATTLDRAAENLTERNLRENLKKFQNS